MCVNNLTFWFSDTRFFSIYFQSFFYFFTASLLFQSELRLSSPVLDCLTNFQRGACRGSQGLMPRVKRQLCSRRPVNGIAAWQRTGHFAIRPTAETHVLLVIMTVWLLSMAMTWEYATSEHFSTRRSQRVVQVMNGDSIPPVHQCLCPSPLPPLPSPQCCFVWQCHNTSEFVAMAPVCFKPLLWL